MTCRAAINQARRPLPLHVLSFASVTPEQEARGIHATCLRCGAEVTDAERWFGEACPGEKKEVTMAKMADAVADMHRRVGKFLEDPGESAESKAVLKWQWNLYGDFYAALFGAIKRADDQNLERLRLGFPVEVAGFLAWNRGGLAQELRAKGVMD